MKKNHRKPVSPGYMDAVLKLHRTPGLYMATVAHDDWCEFWNGGDIQSGKACNCHPVVTDKRIKD